MPEKTYLITPGPTPVPPEVEAAAARPVIHHRSPEFRTLFDDVVGGLRRVFHTDNDVLVIPGSGTYAMESAVVNLLSPGDPVLVATAGNFGERWRKLAAAYGADVRVHEQPWGERLDPARVAAAAEGCRVVFLTQSETSTGVVHDIRAIAEAIGPHGPAVVVDAVSSLGGVELRTDEWGIDVVVSGSQKALMCPPGLAFASVSARAWDMAESSTNPRFAFDWRRIADAQGKGGTPFTPPVTLVAALQAAIGAIERDGYGETYARNRALGRATREGIKAMGLELFSPDDDSSAMVTAVLMPEGIDGQQVYTTLRDRHGVVLAGGQGPLRGRIVRIGHMGYMNRFDILIALSALELALAEHGHRTPSPGAGVARATELFADVEPARA